MEPKELLSEDVMSLEELERWDAFISALQFKTRKEVPTYTILEDTVKELFIPKDKKEDFHIEKADMKKTWDTLQNLDKPTKKASALIPTPMKGFLKREIFNYVLCRRYGWLDLSSASSSAHLIPQGRLYNNKEFRSQMIRIRSAWYCVRMKRNVCGTLKADRILNHYVNLFLEKTPYYWEIMDLLRFNEGERTRPGELAPYWRMIRDSETKVPDALDPSIIPPFFRSYDYYKVQASAIPETHRRLDAISEPLAVSLPAACPKSRSDNTIVITFLEAQSGLPCGFREMYDSRNRPFYMDLHTEMMIRTKPFCSSIPSIPKQKRKRKPTSNQPRSKKPMECFSFDQLPYGSKMEILVRWYYARNNFPRLTENQRSLNKTYKYTALPKLPHLDFLEKKSERPASPDLQFDHDEHTYRALLHLKWAQLPMEIKHWFWHRWRVAVAYCDQRVLRWTSLSSLYPHPLSDSHKAELWEHRNKTDKQLVHESELFANPDLMFAVDLLRMKVEMKNKFRSQGSLSTLGSAIWKGIIAEKEHFYETNESQNNELKAEAKLPEESRLSSYEPEEVNQVEQQDERSTCLDSISHLEREDEYEEWRVKLQPRKNRVDPEETRDLEIIVRLFKNKAVEERCKILDLIEDILNAHLKEERMQEKCLPLVQGDPVELYHYILDRLLDDRFKTEDAMFEILNLDTENEQVRDDCLQALQGTPVLFYRYVSDRVEKMQVREQDPDLFMNSKAWLLEVEDMAFELANKSDVLWTSRALRRFSLSTTGEE